MTSETSSTKAMSLSMLPLLNCGCKVTVLILNSVSSLVLMLLEDVLHRNRPQNIRTL